MLSLLAVQLQWLGEVEGQGVVRVYGSVIVDAESCVGEDAKEM